MVDKAMVAEQWARDRLNRYEPIVFPESWDSKERLLSGEFLFEAISSPNWEGSCQIKNAIITTPISRTYGSSSCEILFDNCSFNAPVVLQYFEAKRRVQFRGCIFREDIDFRASRLAELGFFISPSGQQTVFHRSLMLAGSQISGRFACANSLVEGDADFNTLFINGNAKLLKTVFHGAADFKGLRIAGQLDMTGACFRSAEKEVSFNSATFLGGAILDECEFVATPDFLATEFGRRLQCFRAKFTGQKESTFQRCKVSGDAILEETVFSGPVDFSAMHIEGDLSFKSAKFEKSASFTSMSVKGNAFYQDSKFGGKTVFNSAEVSGLLFFDRIQAAKSADLVLLALHVGGSVSCRKAIFYGTVEFSGAAIDGQLVMDEAECAGLLSLNGTRVLKGLFLNKATCSGAVNCIGSELRGQLVCTNSKFLSDEEVSFSVARIDCDAVFNRSEFNGTLNLVSTVVTRQLTCIGTNFSNRTTSLNLNGGRVEGSAVFWNASFQGMINFRGTKFLHNLTLAGSRMTGFLDASNASVGGSINLFTVPDELPSGVSVGETVLPTGAKLHQFRYASSDLSSKDQWKKWIKLASGPDSYDPDPFVTLESLFRQTGHSDLADKVYIERNLAEDRFLWRKSRFDKWLGKVLLRITVGYGVRGWLLWMWAIPMPLIFFGVCRAANWSPSPVRIAMYAIDVFLPVDLNQQTVCGSAEWWHFITQIWGWLIIPLAVAQLTGFLQRTNVPKAS